jgi:aryl-alcohol dehydrogenase-like predicted oxidoreductase
MGKAFKELGLRREDLVISTKFFRCGKGVNDAFLSRKHIMEGANNSLKRL